MVKFKPDLIVLQETKKEIMGDKLVRSVVGMTTSEWCAVLTIGSLGGILMAWNFDAITKKMCGWGLFLFF